MNSAAPEDSVSQGGAERTRCASARRTAIVPLASSVRRKKMEMFVRRLGQRTIAKGAFLILSVSQENAHVLDAQLHRLWVCGKSVAEIASVLQEDVTLISASVKSIAIAELATIVSAPYSENTTACR